MLSREQLNNRKENKIGIFTKTNIPIERENHRAHNGTNNEKNRCDFFNCEEIWMALRKIFSTKRVSIFDNSRRWKRQFTKQGD